MFPREQLEDCTVRQLQRWLLVRWLLLEPTASILFAILAVLATVYCVPVTEDGSAVIGQLTQTVGPAGCSLAT